VVSLSVANDKHVPVDKIVSRLEKKTVGVSIRVGRSRSKHATPKKLKTVSGQNCQTIDILGNSISLLGGVFSQVNVFQIERLYQIAMEMAKVESWHHVLDLYCGVGTLSVAIAEHAKQVVGIELDAGAIKNAQENASTNDRLNCSFLCADAADSSQWGDPLHQFDVVTVNPPRAGLAPEVIEGIAATRANRVTYISCNPETLARDCKRLCAHNYEVTEVKPVDMFPQTIHVEAIVKLERRNRG
jgi:23S rRNA (uracil1939-C5)-methyltransferase